MARRSELTDETWERIAPLLPVAAGPGRPWRGHRQVVNGILWRFETGATWREIPECYGPWQTCYERYKRWTEDGTWARVLKEAQAREDLAPSRTVSIPPSDLPHGHQKGANASRQPPHTCDNSTEDANCDA
ncbi:transposase [Nonomuraea sp. NPDC052265]|uniref:transposase n=1 Tax=Nonomuraea sp. NPDC052265 TaxID=3364374 RepID=UPI0037C9096B